jgi:hypothetical protein
MYYIRGNIATSDAVPTLYIRIYIQPYVYTLVQEVSIVRISKKTVYSEQQVLIQNLTLWTEAQTKGLPKRQGFKTQYGMRKGILKI